MEKSTENHRKKKEFYKNNEILKGFIITCDNNREKNAINESYNILNEYTERLYPDLLLKQVKKVKNETNSSKLTVDLLENELSQLKEKDERLFYTYDIGIKKGVVFIKINTKFTEISPYILSEAIMTDVHQKKIVLSRYCHKLIPIEKAFTASFDSFKTHILDILKRNFPEESKISWFLEFKSRNNSKFKQKEFLDFLLENIGKNNFVSYKEPKITIFVEINHSTMCLSALKDFFEYNKYALHCKTVKIIEKIPEKEEKIIEKIPEKEEKIIENKEKVENTLKNDISSNEDEDYIKLI